ncbi:MAG: UTRA domain-containing protein [Pseudomonadota bacterium]|nr:UTRA domain-containing protein [Pseudomonadota bacterium]
MEAQQIAAPLAKHGANRTHSAAAEIGDVIVPSLDGEGPLWLQIRRSLALAILSGKWPAGTRVPAELQLTDHYATSRMTVNKALQSLASEGLIERKTKTGSVVTARARERPVLEIWDAADSVRRAGHRYRYKLLECAMAEPDWPARDDLGLGPKTAALRMSCLHLADDVPFQLEERLINIEAAPKITCQPLESVSPGQWLLANVPWTEARHVISARSAPPRIASILERQPGDACLVVERKTWNDDVPVTLVRFWYPGEDHALEGQFRPSW